MASIRTAWSEDGDSVWITGHFAEFHSRVKDVDREANRAVVASRGYLQTSVHHVSVQLGYIDRYVGKSMCACTYLWLCVCMYACMHGWMMDGWMGGWVDGWMDGWRYVCMLWNGTEWNGNGMVVEWKWNGNGLVVYVCMSVCLSVCLSVCMYVCMYVCVHVCLYVMYVRKISVRRCIVYVLYLDLYPIQLNACTHVRVCDCIQRHTHTHTFHRLEL